MRHKLLIGLCAFLTFSLLFSFFPTRTVREQAYLNTVSVTNLTKNSGGSGTILRSFRNTSWILTNQHVCEVAKNGGLVNTADGQSLFVTAYQESKISDLCIITVNKGLGINTPIARGEPTILEKEFVSGHPALLPTIISEGHVAGVDIITIMTGKRACTVDEVNNPNTALQCFFFGGFPVLRSYEAMLVSSLIQPGSSGSAIYSESGEIIGVIFAGSGGIGYGWAMTHTAVVNFIDDELPTLPGVFPSYAAGQPEEHPQTTQDRVKDFCSKATSGPAISLCKILTNYSDLLYLEEAKDGLDYENMQSVGNQLN